MENIIQQVSEMLSKLSFIPGTALKLAFVGVVLLVIVFIISALLTLGSKIKGLTKKLLEVVITTVKMDRVDEENVEVFKAELLKLPESVNDGWGRFMEQRVGYPSDYMKEKSVLDENYYTTQNTAGKIVFKVFGALIIALIAVLTVFLCATDASNIGLKDFVDNFKVVGALISSVLLPVLFFIIFDIIIFAIYRKQRNRLQLTYKTFQDTLDEKVVIYASDEEEFTSENLDEITKNIEQIIAQRMDNKEIIEVITAPKLNAMESNVEQAVEIMPVEEEEVVATQPISKEEQRNYLVVLISIVENAIADPEVKTEDLEQIAELIYTNLGAFDEPEDKAILDECLHKLSDVFYTKKR